MKPNPKIESPRSQPDTVRLQFELASDRVAELDELIRECRMRTRTELLNSALMLFEWAVQERRQGRIIASIDEANDKYKEVLIPAFQAIQKRDQRVAAAAR